MEFLGGLEVTPHYPSHFLTGLLASVSSLYEEVEITAFPQLIVGYWHYLIQVDCGCSFFFF